ncbi:hypothetical protein D3C72_1003230 [compost metagenome]
MLAQADLARRAGEHGIDRADEVTQVVGRGHQPGDRQVELAFGDQLRQLRGQGETADAHGHHQRHGAGQQLNEWRHDESPARM